MMRTTAGYTRRISSDPGVLIYDGHCDVCRASLDWLGRHRRVPPDELASHEASDAQLAAWGLSRGEVTRSVWWVRGRHRFSGHVAVGHLLLGSRRAWPLLGILILWTPLRPVARAGYRVFAWSRPWMPEGVALPARRVTHSRTI